MARKKENFEARKDLDPVRCSKQPLEDDDEDNDEGDIICDDYHDNPDNYVETLNTDFNQQDDDDDHYHNDYNDDNDDIAR